MRIGVLGLGRMGLPIAVALAERHRVVGFDPVPSRVREFVAGSTGGDAAGDEGAGSAGSVTAGIVGAGSFGAESVLAACSEAEVLLTVLAGVGEFEAVLSEVLGAMPAGATWLDLTSNDPRVVTVAAQRAAASGVAFASAPMAGGPVAARERRVRFTASGDDSAVLLAERVLGAAGGPGVVTAIGPRPGDACTVKLLGNLLWFGQAVATAEAMLLGVSLGLEPERLLGLLADGPASGTLLGRDFPAVLQGDYRASFGLDRVVEELDTLTSLAEGTGAPFELSGLVAEVHRQALERFGAVDGELLAVRLLEERAGQRLAGGGGHP
jgi:3-hydroxyisobutyrate dehydrogenase